MLLMAAAAMKEAVAERDEVEEARLGASASKLSRVQGFDSNLENLGIVYFVAQTMESAWDL